MTDSHDSTPAVLEEPIANPGLPAHQWRPTDVDERADKRAERQIAAFFGVSMVCAVLFVVAYFTLEIGDNFDTFLGLGASTVAVTRGSGGVLVGTATEAVDVPAVPPPRVVDQTGAGDVFVGTVAARLACGDELLAAVRLGAAAASLSVQGRGGTGFLPTLAQSRAAAKEART